MNTEQLKPNAKSVKVCLCKVAASSATMGLGLPETGSSWALFKPLLLEASSAEIIAHFVLCF